MDNKTIVPFVDFPASYKKIKLEIDAAIQRCLNNGDFILRKDVEEFEENLAKYVGVKYAVGVNSGTDALFLSLKALEIGQGDEVITSGYTFWATVEAIINCGAKPVLADIQRDSLLIDPEDIKKKITDRTKAIIPVHIGGNVCDMNTIMDIALEKDLFVIEDAAQGLGAIKNPTTNAQCFSFYPAKVLGCYGDGGAITTNVKKIAEKVRLLRDHGRKTKHETVCVGYNSRLDNIQAAILNVKLARIEEIIARRIEIADIYDNGLSCLNGIGQIVLPKSKTYQEYNLVVPWKRDDLYKFLKEKGVETIVGDYTFPEKQPVKAKIANGNILRLPIWPTLTDKQIEYVITAIKNFYGN